MNREYGLEADLMKEAVAAAEKHWSCLHEMPEIAFSEYKTTEYIRNAAAQHPVQEIDLGMDTGFVCFLDAGTDRTVALRADIDALPVENGAKHLCGHDAHDATLLGRDPLSVRCIRTSMQCSFHIPACRRGHKRRKSAY